MYRYSLLLALVLFFGMGSLGGSYIAFGGGPLSPTESYGFCVLLLTGLFTGAGFTILVDREKRAGMQGLAQMQDTPKEATGSHQEAMLKAAWKSESGFVSGEVDDEGNLTITEQPQET